MKKLICTYRKDLNGICLPYGENKYTNPKNKRQRWKYRWINEEKENEQFQIFINGKWENAYSIDFDFIN
jgi:hypothetical protein